jgi:hypothetical protein
VGRINLGLKNKNRKTLFESFFQVLEGIGLKNKVFETNP